MTQPTGIINRLRFFIGGGDDRTRNMKRNSIAMLVVKGLSILVSLAYVPMMLKNVNRADYGVLLTLTSLVQWVAMLDIGLGNGLRNTLAKNLALQEYDKAKENVSSCYAALAIYVSAIVLVFLCVAPFLSWKTILNAPNNSEAELLGLTIVVFVSFCLQFVVNLLTSILYACQKPAYTSYIMFTTQVVNFILVYIMIHAFGITSILEIGSVTCLTPPAVIVIFSIILFRRQLKHISPSFKSVHLKSVNTILNLGVKFFILQIITIVLYQSNNIIITHTVGPEAVVTYNIAYKYMGMITMVFLIIISPVWSAATDAYVTSDFDWMKRTIQYLRKVFLGVLCIGLIMFAASKPIYTIWLGKDTVDVPYIVTGLSFVACMFDILYRIYGTFINGMGKLQLQMIITSAIAVVYIPMAVFLGKHFGLSGVLLANTIVFMANYLWARIQCSKLIKQTATGIWDR